MDQTRQFYQTNLKPGMLYRPVEFITLRGVYRPTYFCLTKDSKEIITQDRTYNSYVLYISSKLPEFVGDAFDKHIIPAHRVLYGETVGWLDGRWLLTEVWPRTLDTATNSV